MSDDLVARARYVAAHWGARGSGRIVEARCADPVGAGTLAALGKLRSVVYETDKRGDGLSEYEHHFSRRDPPLLCFSKFGRWSLVIVGGEYEMTTRGIVR